MEERSTITSTPENWPRTPSRGADSFGSADIGIPVRGQPERSHDMRALMGVSGALRVGCSAPLGRARDLGREERTANCVGDDHGGTGHRPVRCRQGAVAHEKSRGALFGSLLEARPPAHSVGRRASPAAVGFRIHADQPAAETSPPVSRSTRTATSSEGRILPASSFVRLLGSYSQRRANSARETPFVSSHFERVR